MNILAELLNPSIISLLEYILLPLILIVIDVFLFLTLKRTFPKIMIIVLSVILIVSSVLNLDHLFILLVVFYFMAVMLFVFGNIVEYRWLIANSASKKDRSSKRNFRKIYDQEEVINQLNAAVLNLSKTKMGALITIERSNQLNELLKNGSPINAPVSAPLLTTIFYKGTTLHDGAVVIRDATVLAASVYFTPSTKPLSGKVGSRHRAALGISEVTDSVTIVVSEETGRISIAYLGALNPVNADDFKKTLTEYLAVKTEKGN